MNKMMVLVSVLALTGCAGNQTAMHSPADEAKAPVGHSKDNFDKAGEYVAQGTRFVWDETSTAYEWITSKENKKRLERAEGMVKSVVQGAWAAGKEELAK